MKSNEKQHGFSGIFICMGIFFLVANILIMVPSMKFRKTALMKA